MEVADLGATPDHKSRPDNHPRPDSPGSVPEAPPAALRAVPGTSSALRQP
jgi:hypothetical protein